MPNKATGNSGNSTATTTPTTLKGLPTLQPQGRAKQVTVKQAGWYAVHNAAVYLPAPGVYRIAAANTAWPHAGTCGKCNTTRPYGASHFGVCPATGAVYMVAFCHNPGCPAHGGYVWVYPVVGGMALVGAAGTGQIPAPPEGAMPANPPQYGTVGSGQ